MLRSLLIVSSAALAGLALPLHRESAAAETGQSPAASGSVAANAQSPALPAEPRPFLPVEQGAVRFRVSFGRIHLDRLNGRDQRRQAVEYADGTAESYFLRPADGGIEAQYERTRPGVDRVAFTFSPCGAFTLTKECLSPSAPSRMELVQPEQGWMTLTYQSRGEPRTLRAPSLWHLYLTDSQACRDSVVPTLRELGIAIEYASIGERLTELAIAHANEVEPPTREEALGTIHDLSDPSFKVRRAAVDRLRKMGPSLVAWVRLFPVENLDREQCDRLRELISRLEASSNDRPDRLAAWLAEDPWLWFELLSHDQDNVRQLAARRIKALTGESVDARTELSLADEVAVRRTRDLCQQDRGSIR
ncbi:MAG TPA: hypothetical protein VGN57_03320 [Pirellulaceae bacterium]|jgi:hypothetical protein|nr:hypothetical protein [Pirellulaceae bacterium]